MAETLSSLRTRTRRWLHEPVAAESFFSDNLIDNLINAAYRRRCAQIIMASEGSFVQTVSVNIKANEAFYNWPSGLTRVKRVDYVTTDGTEIPIPRFERHTQPINPNNYFSSESVFTFRPKANGIVLEPTPSEDVTNGLKFEYTGTPPELTADTSPISAEFPDIYTELIVLDVVVYLLDTEGNLEEGNVRASQRARAELEIDFNRWVETKIIKAQAIQPGEHHYSDY